MNTKFSKVKLDKGGQSVTFGIEQTTPLNNSDILKSKTKGITFDKPPHQDLVDCFIRLMPHMMFSTGLFKVQKVKADYYNNLEFLEEEQFEEIVVMEVQISGKEENLIKLIGYKTNKDGQEFPLQSAIIDISPDAANKPVLINIFTETLQNLLKEADLYYSKQKYGSFVEQQEFEFIPS